MAPPKPKLVLRIGVTGHRPKNFDAHAQTVVKTALKSLFADITAAAGAIHSREQSLFDPAPPEIRIVSALAEGADQVVAAAGLEAGFGLDAILPFPIDVYETDFTTSEAKSAFAGLLARARVRFVLPGAKNPEDQSEANRAYEAVGLMTLRQCDLLIAVWDGKEASGRGGTEDIVQHAMTSGQPVLRFDEKGNGPHLLQASSIEPSDARDLIARAAGTPNAQAAAIATVVERLCAPPEAASEAASDADIIQKKAGKRAREQLHRFFAEEQRLGLYTAFSYPLLLALFSDKTGFWRSLSQRPFEEATRADWAVYCKALDRAAPQTRKPITEILMPRFAWADGLANRYGQLHRSGYVSNFTLAATAVLFAAMHVSWLEFLVIVLVIALTVRGILGRWHERWVNYRQLSMQLRHLRALTLTGSCSWESRTPHAGEELQAGPHWVNWYCRLAAREMGVVNATIDRQYLDIARHAIRDGEIEDQIEYHGKNAKRMASVAGWLELIGMLAFGATLLICGYEVAANLAWAPEPAGIWRQVAFDLPMFLPALGAALFGMRFQGDFEGSSERSADMERRLTKVSERLGKASDLSFAELSALTEFAAIIMASEAGDWGFVFRGRPLALPI